MVGVLYLGFLVVHRCFRWGIWAGLQDRFLIMKNLIIII